ncbi:hypothetical protein ACIGXM_22200 [Kitasatospora sp. NPDC052896]|uniref:hypothetical protein n=1 Tax=Kitasatospora sp. NPDC052896 TaxID=3364061 RepID=UPI0037C93C42
MAAEVGVRAAGWIRGVAERQDHELHQVVLGAYADAVEVVLTGLDPADEDVPNGRGTWTAGWGGVSAEIREELDGYVVLSSPPASGDRPDLTTVEGLSLVAIGALARIAPAAVTGDIEDLMMLCEAIGQALAIVEENSACSAAPVAGPTERVRMPIRCFGDQ